MAIDDFYRGDTKKYKFTFTKNSVAVDVTAWEIWFTIKENINDSDYGAAAQVKHTAGDDALDNVVNGILYLTLPSDVSAGIGPGEYVYDFQRVIPGATPDVDTLESGTVSIKQDVTITIT